MPSDEIEYDASLEGDELRPEVEAFLRALLALSRRTGVWIGGCGDCGSPWLEVPLGGEHLLEFVRPSEEHDGYLWGHTWDGSSGKLRLAP